MPRTHCFAPVLGKRLRTTRLDKCGRVPADGAANAWLATNGFVTVSLSSEVEDGNEIVTRRADGSVCVNERTANSFKNFGLEIEFCEVNPSLLSMITNAEPYYDYAGDVAGFTVAEGAIEKAFSFELWTGLAGGTCDPDAEEGAEPSGYLLLPYVQAGVIGDIEINGEDSVTFSMTGAFTKGGNGWGVGPYQTVYNQTGAPSFLPTALDAGDHLLMMDTALAPPPSACDPQAAPTGATTTTTTTAAG